MVYTWVENERNLGERELKEGSTRLGWQPLFTCYGFKIAAVEVIKKTYQYSFAVLV